MRGVPTSVVKVLTNVGLDTNIEKENNGPSATEIAFLSF